MKGDGDWDAANGGSANPDGVEQVLRERARQYAQMPTLAEDGARAEVLLFRLRDEQYAVRLGLLRKVQMARSLTRVPCTPAQIAGILNVRGEVVTVLDLASALGLGDPIPPSDRSRVLLVEVGEIRVGLLVDEILGDRLVSVDRLDRALSGRDFVHGVAEAAITFLDLQQLLSGGRFEVLEDV